MCQDRESLFYLNAAPFELHQSNRSPNSKVQQTCRRIHDTKNPLAFLNMSSEQISYLMSPKFSFLAFFTGTIIINFGVRCFSPTPRKNFGDFRGHGFTGAERTEPSTVRNIHLWRIETFEMICPWTIFAKD